MKSILIVVSPYYEDITNEMLAGANAVLKQTPYAVETVTVPGAFEIPAAIAMAHRTGNYAGYIALGCVIRGETSHYDYVCGESARGLQELAVREQAAIGFGILTCENMEQARVRADMIHGDKGGEAAKACLRMIELRNQFGVGTPT